MFKWLEMLKKFEVERQRQIAASKIRVIGLEELALHNRENDCWIALATDNGAPPIVYDVTQYLDFHPGTKKILMDHAGTNATTAFNAHHPYVNFDNVLYPFRIGKLQAK
ncbi:MAG: Cytochrome b5 reductase 4 [Marteilia pararefringens]